MSFRDTQLNTPAEMWVRFVFASRIILSLIGLVHLFSAFYYSSIHDFLKAAVLVSAAVAGHLWLKKRGKLAECEVALERMFNRGGTEENDELETLLERRTALEAHRGEPGFDPWAVQAVRREIHDYVKKHPDASGHLGNRW